MRIVAFEPLGISDKRLADVAAPLIELGHSVVQHHDRVEDLMDMIQRAREADVLILVDQMLPGKIFEACPNIRMVSIASDFHEQIDVQKARAKMVPVSVISEYWTYSVAELTVSLLLAVMKRIFACYDAARGKQVEGCMEGHELFGKTVGIVGTGPTGFHVARILKAFGCELLGYSRNPKKEAEVWAGMQYVTIEELLSCSDVVSLHLALTPETEGFMNRDRIAQMKQGTIFINTAHGKLVDYNSLSEMLKNGWLSGAGIDAFDVESPIGRNHPLAKAPNVVMTPGVGRSTAEAFEKRAELALGNVITWMKGKPGGIVA
ncbi:MAG: NAD(P)-dependent oxidoreductase [Thermovirgaceae bacterium]|nr:NAD(P)-dependent oxidoreductase [Thermovirgaceae bacterium]